MIGGKAPSKYLAQIQSHAQVRLEDGAMNDVLRTHLIDPALLRADDFSSFYAARKGALLTIVGGAMGKPVSQPVDLSSDGQDGEADEDEDEVQG
jgi:hypothetical protein